MKKKIWRFVPVLVMALVVVLAVGVLNADNRLRASGGEGAAQEDPPIVPAEGVQGSTAIEIMDLTIETGETTEPAREESQPAEEPTEPEQEVTEPAEETTEPALPEEVPEETEPSEPESNFTVSPVGYSGTYDARSHSASYTVSDPVGTTVTYSVDGGATWTAAAPSIKNVDEITFLVKAENPNYGTAISRPGTLKVTPASLVITTAGAKKTYDGRALTASGIKVTGLVGGESLRCNASGHRTDVGQSKNVYIINWFDSTAKKDNYTITNEYGILEVTPAVLRVTTYSGSKLYDCTPLTAGGMITGFIWGEDATFTVTGSQTEEGTSDNTYTLLFDGSAKAENYTVTETLGTLTVTPAP